MIDLKDYSLLDLQEKWNEVDDNLQHTMDQINERQLEQDVDKDWLYRAKAARRYLTKDKRAIELEIARKTQEQKENNIRRSKELIEDAENRRIINIERNDRTFIHICKMRLDGEVFKSLYNEFREIIELDID